MFAPHYDNHSVTLQLQHRTISPRRDGGAVNVHPWSRLAPGSGRPSGESIGYRIIAATSEFEGRNLLLRQNEE